MLQESSRREPRRHFKSGIQKAPVTMLVWGRGQMETALVLGEEAQDRWQRHLVRIRDV